MKTIGISIDVNGFQMEGNVTVSTEPVSPGELLPLARIVSDMLVDQTSGAIEESGQSISCKKGCAACCRHLVSLSEIEARALYQLIENLPEPERASIRARYAQVLQKLDAEGLLSMIRNFASLTANERLFLMTEYLKHFIACPFLKDECCTIHPERPLMCREYLVTSAAENCLRPTPDNIRRINLPLWTHNAVARLQVPASAKFMERWVPLVLVPEWAESNPEPAPFQSGEHLMQELFNHLISTGDLFDNEPRRE